MVWPGSVKDTERLTDLGILESLGNSVEIHDARESAEGRELHKLTDFGRDVARYMFAVRQEETQDKNAL